MSKNASIAARSAADVVKLISMKLSESTEKLSFLKVIEVQKFSRPEKKDVKGIKVAGIRKLHSITRTVDGCLLGKELTCLKCILDKCSICSDCQKLPPFFCPKEQVVIKQKEDEDCEDTVEDVENDDNAVSQEDKGASEEELEDEENCEEEDSEELFGPGSVAWARLWGEKVQWFPVLVLGCQDIPAELASMITKDNCLVRRFFFDDLRLVKKKFLNYLGENKVDGQRSSKSIEIMQAYNWALSEKND